MPTISSLLTVYLRGTVPHAAGYNIKLLLEVAV